METPIQSALPHSLEVVSNLVTSFFFENREILLARHAGGPLGWTRKRTSGRSERVLGRCWLVGAQIEQGE